MQVLLLGLFVAVYLHDLTTAVNVVEGGEVVREAEALPGDVWPGLGVWAVLLIVALPKLFVCFSYWLACRNTYRRLGTERGQRALNRLEAMTSALPLLLLCLFIADLSAGSLRHLRVPLRISGALGLYRHDRNNGSRNVRSASFGATTTEAHRSRGSALRLW